MGLLLEDIIKGILSEGGNGKRKTKRTPPKISFDRYSRYRDEIISAIENKNYMLIMYDDGKSPHLPGNRYIMPIALGTTKKGYPVLRAYQIVKPGKKGVSRSKPGKTDYRFFRLDRIRDCISMPYTFKEAPDGRYNPNGDNTMGDFLMNIDTFSNTSGPLDPFKDQRYERDYQPEPYVNRLSDRYWKDHENGVDTETTSGPVQTDNASDSGQNQGPRNTPYTTNNVKNNDEYDNDEYEVDDVPEDEYEE